MQYIRADRVVCPYNKIYKNTKEKGETTKILSNVQVGEYYFTDDDKYVVALDEDNNLIETVLMSYHHGYTICVSSQIGCKMGCKFCASTGIPFSRDLEAGEIVEQLLAIERDEGVKISNIVFMGIGEPLDNFDNVMKSIEIINHQKGLNIGARHISISTSGIVPKIYQLADEDNKKITHLHDFSQMLLRKCALGQLISKYMVLVASEKKLMIMRPYQIYAVRAIMDCIEQNRGNGYIWHTTGSGKTLTSFKEISNYDYCIVINEWDNNIPQDIEKKLPSVLFTLSMELSVAIILKTPNKCVGIQMGSTRKNSILRIIINDNIAEIDTKFSKNKFKKNDKKRKNHVLLAKLIKEK